jgi:hypothetical protein
MEKNGIGICSWTEWENLSEDQRRYEMHRVLLMLDNRTREILSTTKRYSFLGGIIGGCLTVLGIFGAKLMAGF